MPNNYIFGDATAAQQGLSLQDQAQQYELHYRQQMQSAVHNQTWSQQWGWPVSGAQGQNYEQQVQSAMETYYSPAPAPIEWKVGWTVQAKPNRYITPIPYKLVRAPKSEDTYPIWQGVCKKGSRIHISCLDMGMYEIVQKGIVRNLPSWF